MNKPEDTVPLSGEAYSKSPSELFGPNYLLKEAFGVCVPREDDTMFVSVFGFFAYYYGLCERREEFAARLVKGFQVLL